MVQENRIALDTMVFIYHLEDYRPQADQTEKIFQKIEDGRYAAVTSYITLLELLVKPKRAGEYKIASDYRDLLLTFPNLVFVPVDAEVADLASHFRARYAFTTPDAIQIATAVLQGASAFITNDEKLRKVKEIPVKLLKEYE
jgi:predicted nucleic acid-binding protein